MEGASARPRGPRFSFESTTVPGVTPISMRSMIEPSIVSTPIVENACHTSRPADCEYVLSSGEHAFTKYPGPMLSVFVLENRPEASGRKAEYQKRCQHSR